MGYKKKRSIISAERLGVAIIDMDAGCIGKVRQKTRGNIFKNQTRVIHRCEKAVLNVKQFRARSARKNLSRRRLANLSRRRLDKFAYPREHHTLFRGRGKECGVFAIAPY